MLQNNTKVAALVAALSLTGMSSAFAATPVSITASDAQSGHSAENTHDGSLDTRWSAQGNGQWVQYDFGGPVTLSAIEIAFLNGDSRTSTFQIESSDDANSWNQQPMGLADGSSAQLQSYALTSDVTAQYFRIVGYGNSSNSWNSITETAFIDGGTSSCQAITVTASADDGNVASNVMDGDLSTRWSANGEGQTLTQDWCGATKEFSGVDIAFFKGDSRSTTFSIEVNSGGTWTTALAKTTSASNTNGLQTFNFDQPITGTQMRYTGYGNSSNAWNSVTEFAPTLCNSSDEDGCGFQPDVCDIDYNSQACLDQRCPIDPDGEGCPIIIDPVCEQMSYNGECADYSEVYEAEHGEIGENDHITNRFPIEMSFDALAAKHTTPNGNGWRHELKIKSSGGYRVSMTELYEEFKATITAHLDPGAKTIVAQHHASDTGTITKLYIADLNEGGFEPAPDGTESNSIALDGIFDVYIRLAKEDGSGETKHLLTTIRSGESFDFEEVNDHGVVTVKINGQTLDSVSIEDSTESYFKFGNYQQAQNPATNEKLSSDDQDSWPAFYNEWFSTSVIEFTNMSYIRNID
nr:hypothetical protein KPDKLGBK_00004 [uncultured bacterium]